MPKNGTSGVRKFKNFRPSAVSTNGCCRGQRNDRTSTAKSCSCVVLQMNDVDEWLKQFVE
jgi:hypothetical protein